MVGFQHVNFLSHFLQQWAPGCWLCRSGHHPTPAWTGIRGPKIRWVCLWLGLSACYPALPAMRAEKRGRKALYRLGITFLGHRPRPGKRPELPARASILSHKLFTPDPTNIRNFLFEAELLWLPVSGSRGRTTMALDSDPLCVVVPPLTSDALLLMGHSVPICRKRTGPRAQVHFKDGTTACLCLPETLR